MGKKFLPHLSVLVAVLLLGGIFLTINASRENQDQRSKAAGTNNPLPLTTDGIHQFLTFNYQEPNEPGGYMQEQGVIDYVWGANLGRRGGHNEAVPGVWHEAYIPWTQDGDATHDINWFITNHPDWIQYTSNTCNGASTYRTANCVAKVFGHAHAPLDYTNPAVQAYLFSDFIDPYMTATPPFNGISFDDNPSINWGKAKGHWNANGQWVAQYSGESYDDPAWTRAQAIALQQIRTTFKTKYPTGSITVNDTFYMGASNTNWGAELPYADMFMQEGGFFGGYFSATARHVTSEDAPFATNTWLTLATTLVQKQKQYGIGLGIINQVPYALTYHVTDTNAQARADVQWALANYLMVKYDRTYFWIGGTDEHTYNNYGQGPSVLAQREFDAQYRTTNANAIGHPINRGNGSDFYAAQNVYMRDFSNGLAIVNPSASTAYTVYLPPNVFKDLYGNVVGNTYTMQPYSGVVLLGTTATPIATSNITWTNPNGNVTINGPTLTKTRGTNGSWDAGATSTQTLSGNGSVEITINDNNNNGRMFGLNHNNTTAAHTDIDYAFYFASSGVLQIYENGVNKSAGQSLSYTVGDKFKVAIENGVVKYYKNSTVLYTSTQTPAYPLFVDVSLRDLNAKISTSILVVAPPPPSNITWTNNNANASINGTTLTKTGGTNGSWDAGARSTQTITSGSGSAEITIRDNTANGRMFGFNHDNTTASYTDIDYAFYFASSGTLQIYENGINKSQGHTYALGDKFKVAIENGVVNYYKNGTLLYTSTQTPTYPLFVDVSLRDLQAKIATGNIVGASTPTPTTTTVPTVPVTPTSAVPTPTRTPTPTNIPTPTPTLNGLIGSYFANKTLTGTATLTRTDPFVNFNWSTSSPASGIPVDNFSVRWTGYVVPRYSQTYTFYTLSDDGVKLWVNGVQLINNWTNHSSTENKGTITLTAGVKYQIKMEYYENTSSAVAGLFWSSPSQAKQIIPQSQLFTQ